MPSGVLQPCSAYFWRVAYVGSNGGQSAFSDETMWVAPEFAWKVSQLDLSPYFNRDVVANPGDPENDSADDWDCMLTVTNYDGTPVSNPEANGLPLDRTVGVHRLGDYDGLNVIQLRPGDTEPIRLEVEPQSFTQFRFLVMGTHRDSTLTASVEYVDGTKEQVLVPADDWYEDNGFPAPDGLRPDVVPVMNSMDRICGMQHNDDNDPAMFEVRVAVDPAQEVVAIWLDPARSTFGGRPTRFHLFAVTGILVDR